MNKKKIAFLFSGIAILTITLLVAGFLFNKTDEEKQEGLTEVFDVSLNGAIAYVTYSEGQQRIRIKSGEEEKEALRVHKDKIILDIAFSPDGTSLTYSVTQKELEDTSLSSINQIDVETLEETSVFQKQGIITEIAFDPKDKDRLFYLKAETYENYSPIARANPHDFDVHEFTYSKEEHTTYTNLKKYSMGSLQVSPTENAVYLQMFDDEHAETAEDIFDAYQRVFKIPLENPEEFTVISDENKDVDIYDFALLSNEEKIIYQSISNAKSGGTFQYELFEYDIDTEEETQMTHLNEYVSRPIIVADHIYFIVDKKFGRQMPEYHLYKMGLYNDKITEVKLSE